MIFRVSSFWLAHKKKCVIFFLICSSWIFQRKRWFCIWKTASSKWFLDCWKRFDENNWILLRLRITAIFPPIRWCVIGKYIRTCNSLSALTGNSLTIEPSLCELACKRESSNEAFLRSPFLAFASASSRLGHSLSSLFPIFVSLFLTFSVFSLSPSFLSLSLVLYVHYTNNSSVSTETSLPAPRLSRSLFSSSFLLLSFSRLFVLSSLPSTLFNFSSLINCISLSYSPGPASSYSRVSLFSALFAFFFFLRKEEKNVAKNHASFVIVWQWQCVWGVTMIRISFPLPTFEIRS